MRRIASLDVLFATLVVATACIVYLVPLLLYPGTPSNPWPYAYNAIQTEIIRSGHFENLVPQFGVFVRMDYGWFAVHHLNIIAIKLISGLSFESLERILSFLLSIVFFYGFYIFSKRIAGRPVGFASSIVLLLLPRIHNYLVTVNGEFLGWVILLPALVSFLAYARSLKTSFLILTCILASSLIIANLIVFVEYLLIVASYIVARIILHQEAKRILQRLPLVLALAVLLIPVPVLLTTGDIRPGPSSTIGAIYSSRSPTEIRYENIYYQRYDWYWQLFTHQNPLQVQAYYLSDDGNFLNFFVLLFAPLAILGVISCVLQLRKPSNLFVLIWLGGALLFSSLLLSPLFNETINAGAIRLLLYFGLPLSMVAGKGLFFLWERAKPVWKRGLIVILVSLLIVEGVHVAALSAGSANAFPPLYAKEYQDALHWLQMNTPTNATVVANEWTGGDIWVMSQRLSIDEGGKGSATYSSYQQIVTRLDDASTILTTQSVNQTLSLMNKYNARWVLVWNRPATYYVASVSKIAFAKFQSDPNFERVFEEPQSYIDDSYSALAWYSGPRVVIYHLRTGGVLTPYIPANVAVQASGAPQVAQTALEASSLVASATSRMNFVLLGATKILQQGCSGYSFSESSFRSIQPPSLQGVDSVNNNHPAGASKCGAK